MMKILALEPFYGGSHKSFIDGCAEHSKHKWTVLTLPPFKWKWRMRHSAVTFANQVNELLRNGQTFDLLFCTDMLPLAEFKGLVHPSIAQLPSILYFHENQLTYPVQVEKERDLHFAINNFISMKAADQIWFNSTFHKDSFFIAIEKMLKRMPEDKMLGEIVHMKKYSKIFPQAIKTNRHTRKPYQAPVHIGWVARWEFDKNPELFFSVLRAIKSKKIKFKLSVIGESFKNCPEIFEKSQEYFKDEIVNWGYIGSFDAYQKALKTIDVLVSTADHEFFGISVMEAIDAGVYPLLPKKLSYPELLRLDEIPMHEKYFYSPTEKKLTKELIQLIENFQNGTVSLNLQEIAKSYYWDKIGVQLDYAISQLHKN